MLEPEFAGALAKGGKVGFGEHSIDVVFYREGYGDAGQTDFEQQIIVWEVTLNGNQKQREWNIRIGAKTATRSMEADTMGFLRSLVCGLDRSYGKWLKEHRTSTWERILTSEEGYDVYVSRESCVNSSAGVICILRFIEPQSGNHAYLGCQISGDVIKLWVQRVENNSGKFLNEEWFRNREVTFDASGGTSKAIRIIKDIIKSTGRPSNSAYVESLIYDLSRFSQ